MFKSTEITEEDNINGTMMKESKKRTEDTVSSDKVLSQNIKAYICIDL